MKGKVLDKAPPTGARFQEGTEVAKLVATLVEIYTRMNGDIEKIRNSRSVSTATGRELDFKAEEFGVDRPTGESDEAFRRRAIAGRVRSRSQATWEDFAEGVLQLLDADPNDVSLNVDYSDERGAVIAVVSSSVIEDSPFSLSTIRRFLEGMIPMSRRVVIRTSDGFQFSDPSTTDQKTGKGFGQGVWTE
jgi:hypothetical protein